MSMVGDHMCRVIYREAEVLIYGQTKKNKELDVHQK